MSERTGQPELDQVLEKLEECPRTWRARCESNFAVAVTQLSQAGESRESFVQAVGAFYLCLEGSHSDRYSTDSWVRLSRWNFAQVWPEMAPHYGDINVGYEIYRDNLEDGRLVFQRRLLDACIRLSVYRVSSNLAIEFVGSLPRPDIYARMLVVAAYCRRYAGLYPPGMLDPMRIILGAEFTKLLINHASTVRGFEEGVRRAGVKSAT